MCVRNDGVMKGGRWGEIIPQVAARDFIFYLFRPHLVQAVTLSAAHCLIV